MLAFLLGIKSFRATAGNVVVVVAAANVVGCRTALGPGKVMAARTGQPCKSRQDSAVVLAAGSIAVAALVVGNTAAAAAAVVAFVPAGARNTAEGNSSQPEEAAHHRRWWGHLQQALEDRP